MSKTKIILFLLFVDLFFFVVYFFLKIYFQPVAIVAPHHNVVAAKRLDFFQQIADKRIFTKKIILIGPDHFSPNQNNLNYSNTNWKLSNGELLFLKELEPYLSPLLNLQDGVIKNDHAIFNLASDIKSVWPDAKIFPILIGQNYSISRLDNLISKIETICDLDCLLIASVDFSHYLPSGFANVHDQKSIYDLATQNLSEIPKLEVDSPQSLFVLSSFSKTKKATKWELYYHSNSGELINNPYIETTSHIFGSYQRSFIKNTYPEIKTYLLAKNIDQNKSQKSLGSRFFYGTDYIDLNYSSRSIYKLPFDLPNNTIVTVTTVNGQPNYYYFSTEVKNGATFFLRK